MKFAIILSLLMLIHTVVYCKDTTSKTTTATTTEIPSDSVKVHFMDFKRSEFLEVLPKLKSAFQVLFTEYCNLNETIESGGDCRLYGKNATVDMFQFDGKDDKEKFVEDNRYVIASMYIETPNDDDGEKIPVQLVKDFLLVQRNKIAEQTGVQIAFINDKFVYPKRNNLDNYIIIPISCAVFLALFIVNFACSRKIEKSQKEEFLRKFRKPTNIVKRSGSTERTDKGEEVQLLQGKVKFSRERHEPQSAQQSPKKGVQSTETPTTVKRKKLRSSKDPNFIAGSANEGIGSSHQLAHDDTWAKNVNEQRKGFGSFHNNFSLEDAQMNADKYKPQYVSGDVSENQLKRNRNNNRNNYEYPDPRVAQRLASYERLPSTYDNMRVYEPFPKPKNSGSTRKVDI